MAIKAGLVGVNPKGVDKNGMPIGSGGANVEAEIQQINLDIAQLQASKVGIGQLTANNKAFHFAYDSTSEKYGYKLDGTGDFIPFEQAGGGPGWVKPAELVTTGLTPASGVTIEEGGYYNDTTNHIAYIDVVFSTTSSASAPITGFPHPPKVTYGTYLVRCEGATVEIAKNNYSGSYYTTIDYSGNMATSVNANSIYHIYGQYEYTV